MRTWSTRAAADAAGVTRAMVRTAVELDLVPSTDLSLVDLLQMKANSFVRGIRFPGEQRAGHLRRVPLLEREKQLVAAVAKIVAANQLEAAVLFHRSHVTIASNAAVLVTQVAAAATTGEPYVTLPIGVWLVEISSTVTDG